MDERNKVIIKTSIIGIVVNIFLSIFKAVIGFLVNSIAIILDAVNNLSDALSSVITIIGTKLASKKPDRKHPLGHGRIEYLSAMLVSAIILYAGVTSLIESIKKIINPEKADYSVLSIVILIVAIITKVILGTYVKKKGKEVNSASLSASGKDALFDAVISTSVLASAVIFLIFGISLEAYVGVIISLVIIKAGLEMMSETASDILGRRPSPELTLRIKKLINEEPEVRGAYDLLINNYGPDRNYATVHVELPDTMTVEQVDILTRRLQAKVYLETGVVLTGVGVYSYNTKDNEAARIRNKVQTIVLSHSWALQLHGFYVNIPDKYMRFDTVLSFDVDHAEAVHKLTEEISEKFEGYKIEITPDVDLSDI
jgi:cation diffusion facilitator family transporter